jgi:hypothetical protein
VIVPSRGRPQHLPRIVEAWAATGAFDRAALMFAVDADDPEIDAYREAFDEIAPAEVLLSIATCWRPMVAKLNRTALRHSEVPFALGFAGDDHLPRTYGWAGRYLDELHSLGTGIVYGDDGMRGEELPTQWAMTSDIVRILGRMVPCDVDHLYCDNAVRELGKEAGCLRYLPDVLVEHLHPFAGKAEPDEGYARVNHPEQYQRDLGRYLHWQAVQMHGHVTAVRGLRMGRQ